MISVDLSGRYASAFGLISSLFGKKPQLKQSDFIVSTFPQELDPTFDMLTLKAKGQSIQFAFSEMTSSAPGVFATPPILSWERAKRLVITPINDSDFEVVERYNTEPYDINMRGLLIDSENHIFPGSKLKTLNGIFEVNESWDVESDIFQLLGVTSIFFKNVSINFVEGYPDTLAYTLNARSIKSAEYQLITGQ